MRRLWILLALAGCGATPQPTPRAPAIAPPVKPKRVHTMQPIELVIHGVPARGVRRAILARLGEARLRREDPSITSEGWAQPDHRAVAIAEVDGDAVRMVHDDDDARLLVWISRADLARVTTREVEVVPGVVLAPGTLVTDRDDVALEGLAIHERIDPDALGDLWDAAPAVARDDGDHDLAPDTPIRAAPDDDAAILAVTTEQLTVHAEPAEAGWLAIVSLGPQVTVRGYVHDVDAGFATSGTGSGSGYGASHAISIDVPAGACLYDAIGGEVIGVNVIARSRLAHEAGEAGWYYLYVGSPWALLRVPAHTTDGAFDVCANLAP